MPSHLHEGLAQLFRNRPLLAGELLPPKLRAELPRHTDACIHCANLTEVQPAEYRADLVVVLGRDKPVRGIIVEVQLSRDRRKRYVWPAYTVNLYARLECPVHVLVVAPNKAVARWAARPVDIGGGNLFAPIVIGPASVPVIDNQLLARSDPELAVLSAMAHGQDRDFMKAARIAAAAQRSSEGLDSDRADLYVDLIHTSLSKAAIRELREMMPPNYQFQSALAKMNYRRGKRKGQAEGNRKALTRAITILLTQRFGPLDKSILSRIAATSGVKLQKVTERLLSAPTLEDALGSSSRRSHSSARRASRS